MMSDKASTCELHKLHAHKLQVTTIKTNYIT